MKIKNKIIFSVKLFSDIVLYVLTIGELTAVLEGKPVWLWCRLWLDLVILVYLLARLMLCFISFLSPTVCSFYSTLDILFRLAVNQKDLDIFGILIAFFFLFYFGWAFIYGNLYLFRKNPTAHLVMQDIFQCAYQDRRSSHYFPELDSAVIRKQVHLIMHLVTFLYFVFYSVLGISMLQLWYIVLQRYAWSIIRKSHPTQLVLIAFDGLLLLYFSARVLHLHLYASNIVFIGFTIARDCYLYHNDKMNALMKTLRSGKGPGRYELVMIRNLLIKRIQYQMDILRLLNGTNTLFSQVSFVYVLGNMINPAILLCYLSVKKHIIPTWMFYIGILLLLAYVTTVPSVYYLAGMLNSFLSRAIKDIPRIQYHLMGEHNARFKLYLNDIQERIIARKRPGFTIGPSLTVVTKGDAIKFVLLYTGYFFLVWKKFFQFYSDTVESFYIQDLE